MKLNLNMPARAELKVEATEVLQAVEEDRRFVYQATIVRLMKGRKVSSSRCTCICTDDRHSNIKR